METASDENYAPYLSVMIATALENCNKTRRIKFYVIDDGLSEYSKEGLEETVNKYSSNASIQFLTVEKDIYEDFLVSDHITTTAYLRISLPNLLAKEDYKKVLYLDSDVLVLDDIVKLYDEPLNGKTIGAIIDPGQVKALERLGIDSDDLYFNSGVMVIDIDQWNKKEITEKTIHFLLYTDVHIFHLVLDDVQKSAKSACSILDEVVPNLHKVQHSKHLGRDR